MYMIAFPYFKINNIALIVEFSGAKGMAFWMILGVC